MNKGEFTSGILEKQDIKNKNYSNKNLSCRTKSQHKGKKIKDEHASYKIDKKN